MKLASIQAVSNTPITNTQVTDGTKSTAKPVSRVTSAEFQRQVSVNNTTHTDRTSHASESDVRSRKTLASTEQRDAGRAKRGQGRAEGRGLGQLADAEAIRAGIEKELSGLGAERGKGLQKGLGFEKGAGFEKSMGLEKGMAVERVAQQRAEKVDLNGTRLAGDEISGKATADATKGGGEATKGGQPDGRTPNLSELSRTDPATQTNLGERATNVRIAEASSKLVRGEGNRASSLPANVVSNSNNSATNAAQSTNAQAANANVGAGGNAGGVTFAHANPASNAIMSNDGTINLQMARGDMARGTEASLTLNTNGLVGPALANNAPAFVPFADLASARYVGKTKAEEHTSADDAAIEEARDEVVEGAEETQAPTMMAESGADTVEVLWIGEEESKEKKVERGAGDGSHTEEIIEELKENSPHKADDDHDEGQGNSLVNRKSTHAWYETSNLNEQT